MHCTPRRTTRAGAALRTGTALTAAAIALTGVAAVGPAAAAPSTGSEQVVGSFTPAELARARQAQALAATASAAVERQEREHGPRAARTVRAAAASAATTLGTAQATALTQTPDPVGKAAKALGKPVKPGKAKPKPAPTSPAPTVPPVVPTPVPTTPAPVETTPAPVETTPAPVETTPAPVETTPAPVETTPAPVETTPAPPPVASNGPVVRYVDPAGDDAADGLSPATALRTLDAVNALDLQPGDEVRLKGGAVFRGGLLLGAEDAGTSAAPVVLGSYDGRATIEAGTGSGVVVVNAGGVRVEGLTLVGSGQVGTDVRGDGVLFYTDLDGGVRLPAVAVSDVEVSGFGNAGVQVGAWNASWSGFSAVSVRDVVAHDNGDAGISTFGFFKPRARSYSLTDVTVERSTAYGNRGIPGKGTDSGSGIQLGGVDRGTVRGSEAHDNGALNDAATSPAGIMVWESTRVTVSDNDVHDNRSGSVGGAGVAFAGGVSLSTMTGNVSSGNSGSGYLVSQPEGFRPTAGNTVVRNVSTDDGRRAGAGIELAGPAGGSGVVDTDVHLNTVTVSPVAGSAPAAVRVSDPVDAAAVHDNVLVARRGAVLLDVVGGSEALVFSRNTYTTGAGGFLVVWDGQRYTSLASWRTATGQEPSGA